MLHTLWVYDWRGKQEGSRAEQRESREKKAPESDLLRNNRW